MAKKMQEFLPGQEPKKNNRVHKAALRYAELRDARIAANEEEKDAHDTLLHTMLEEGLESYEYGDLKVFIDNKRKCKVSTKVEANGKAEDNGEAE